jgi:valacyclovir hydrolase
MKLSRRNLLVASAAASVGFGAKANTGRVHEVAGARLSYELAGPNGGRPLVLLHGGLGHSGWFDELKPVLSQSGFRSLLIDTRGMGKSTLGSAPLSYERCARDAVAIMDAVGMPRASLLGFSDGGIVGYRLAVAAPARIDRLVTIGSRWSAQNGAAMWGAFDSWNRKSLSEGPFKFIVDDYDRLNPDRDFDRMMRQAAAMWKDSGSDGHPEASIGRIQRPTLVVVGDNDPFLSVGDAWQGVRQIKDAQMLVIPSATHPAYRERPEVFNPAMLKFLTA